MKKIIILMLTVALSFYPSVTSFAADEITEIQESLPIPNPGPPAPKPRIDPPTPPEPTPKNPSSDPASWDNDNSEDGTWNYYETSPEAEPVLKIVNSQLQKISNNQLQIEETIRRNQLETRKAIRTLTAIMILTDLLLAMRIILLPIIESSQSKQDNANQEETRPNNPEPSFDPDMMDK